MVIFCLTIGRLPQSYSRATRPLTIRIKNISSRGRNRARIVSSEGYCSAAIAAYFRVQDQGDTGWSGEGTSENRKSPRSLGTKADLQLGKRLRRDPVPHLIQQSELLPFSGHEDKIVTKELESRHDKTEVEP